MLSMLISLTDSEWAFALFLSKVILIHENFHQTELFVQLPDPSAKSFTPDILKKAMLETISSLNVFAEEAHITEVSFLFFKYLNFNSWYQSSPVWWTSVSPTERVWWQHDIYLLALTRLLLWYAVIYIASSSHIEQFVVVLFRHCVQRICQRRPLQNVQSRQTRKHNYGIVYIFLMFLFPADAVHRLPANRWLSRKVKTHFLSICTVYSFDLADWMEIRTNHMVVITPKMNLLQIPIVDKFYVPPSDPAALNRDTDFAAAKGLLSPRRALAPVHATDNTPMISL